MKKIYYINLIAFIITLLLYLTIWLGLIAQIALGFIQLILSLILRFDFNYSDKRKHLNYYHLIVIFYSGLFFIPVVFESFMNNIFGIIIYIILPMSIASYFTWIVDSPKKTIL